MHDPSRSQSSTVAGLLVALLLALPAGAGAQEVRGTLVAEETGEPLSGAYVVLEDSAGSRVVAGLSSDDGAFRLRAPGPGRYRLRVQRIGYRTWESDPFRLSRAEVMGGEYRIPLSPVRLSELRVQGERACTTDPEEGTVAAALREEALKALETVRWTRRARPYVFTVVRRVRFRDPETFNILSQEESSRDSVAGALPFGSLPVARLQEEGYVQEKGDTTVYFGPDDDVLLSDRFWAEHCFETVPGGEGRDLVGLSFRPTPGREKPDIEGVIWLDRDSVMLRRVEFGYTGTEARISGEHLGGELGFRRLPGGGWILDRWSLRIPVTGRATPGLIGLRTQGGLEQTVAIREISGEVTGITRRFESIAGARPSEGVTVAGMVLESATGAPVSGARVVLPEVGLAARTGQDGDFQISDLPAGEHRLQVDRPVYRALGVEPPAEEVWTRPGRYYRVTLRLPSRETLASRACGRTLDGGTVLAGRVLDGDSREPVDGARLIGRIRQEPDSTGAAEDAGERIMTWDTRSDEDGYFRICGVPAAATLDLRVAADGYGTLRRNVPVDEPDAGWFREILLSPAGDGAS